jgi:hypothetical protein
LVLRIWRQPEGHRRWGGPRLPSTEGTPLEITSLSCSRTRGSGGSSALYPRGVLCWGLGGWEEERRLFWRGKQPNQTRRDGGHIHRHMTTLVDLDARINILFSMLAVYETLTIKLTPPMVISSYKCSAMVFYCSRNLRQYISKPATAINVNEPQR